MEGNVVLCEPLRRRGKLGEGGKEIAVIYGFFQGQSEWRKDITIVVMGLIKLLGRKSLII
jgi:hypothetical protein